jgi:hypothetical protein
MSTAMTATEKALRERSARVRLSDVRREGRHPLPDRDAPCRPPGYPKGTKVDVRKKPCAERASLAWPATLAELRH